MLGNLLTFSSCMRVSLSTISSSSSSSKMSSRGTGCGVRALGDCSCTRRPGEVREWRGEGVERRGSGEAREWRGKGVERRGSGEAREWRGEGVERRGSGEVREWRGEGVDTFACHTYTRMVYTLILHWLWAGGCFLRGGQLLWSLFSLISLHRTLSLMGGSRNYIVNVENKQAEAN